MRNVKPLGLKAADCKLGMIVWCKQGKRMIKGEIVAIVGTDVFVTWPEIGVYTARENPALFLPEPVVEQEDDMDLSDYEEAEAASD